MKSLSQIVLGLCAAIGLASVAAPALAGPRMPPPPPPHHEESRVVTLKERIAMTDARIEHARRHHRISGRLAAHLHREVRDIRHDERRFAMRHRGHLTPGEFNMLYSRLEHVNRRLDR